MRNTYTIQPALPIGLGHLIQQQHLQVRDLVVLRVSIQHGMAEDMRRISPSLSMFDVRLNRPLEDWIVIIVQSGRRLPHSRTTFIWIDCLTDWA